MDNIELTFNDLPSYVAGLGQKVDSILKYIEDTRNGKKETTSAYKPNLFLSVKDVSKILNRAPATIYGLCREKLIPFYKEGSRVVFKKDEVIKWYESNLEKIATTNEISKDVDDWLSRYTIK